MESYAIVGLGTVRIQCVVYLRLKCGTVVQHGSNLKRFLGSSDRTLSLSLRGAPFCQGWGAGADRAGGLQPRTRVDARPRGADTVDSLLQTPPGVHLAELSSERRKCIRGQVNQL